MNIFLDYLKDNKSIKIGLNFELKTLEIIRKFKEEKNILVVTNSLYEANMFYKSLSNYTDDILFFPMDDFLTSEAMAISLELKYKRLETLNILSNNSNKIVVTNLMGYLRFLPVKEDYINHKLTIDKKNSIDIKLLEKKLFNLGYQKESIVNKTGEFALRGFVLDIFPNTEDTPVRIEFWGDEIDTIKTFDVDSQLTKTNLDEINIFPNTEFLTNKEVDFENISQKNLYKYEKVSSIVDYLQNSLTVFINYNDIMTGYELLVDEILEYSKSKEVSNQKYMHDFSLINKGKTLILNDFDDNFNNDKLTYNTKDIDYFPGNTERINELLNKYLNKYKKVFICVNNRYSVNKINDELNNSNIVFTDLNNYIDKKINLVIIKMTKGFIIDDLVVITERELFGKKDSFPIYKTKFKLGTRIRDINKLNVGDYVVHAAHGIGRYSGIKTLTKNGIKKDYLQVEYAGRDKLYIPVEKIEFISKYSTNESLVPKLNKLGTTDWEKTKLRVKKKIESIAADLLRLYAEREHSEGFAFEEDSKEQYEFDNDFGYELTNDQKKAIADIKEDMQNNKPMDRLLCGDVGFGKTEVAFRAMFKAVLSGKQVAFLCPTTILSNQHYKNAIERFSNFGVNIALLNRFITGSKLKETLEKLKEGKIDILIGTHRILGKDVIFKDLGLLVVDEEQRFGVTHKEKIKQYKNNIDVLTLSATPIPRTLQMSMSGLRSLSLIETAPVNRYPVQTYVLAENKQIIKDAIYKELSRDGQTFILYNHVDGILSKVEEIKRLVPEARITYAHGKMTKTELEDVMLSFTNHEYDVLVCTTIIETGIDIANANTLLILDADHFGLSQLYQIRGRVGRSDKIAYCYLMYDNRKILSEIALKRLKVIKEFTELGSGFAIAVRDLSIRGAGDILGGEQSGFIDSVGVEMFLNMLNDEIRKLKGEEVIDKPESDKPLLDVDTTIDDSYELDEDIKIEIHKKINEINSIEKLNEVKYELNDRFGKVDDKLNIYMYEQLFENMSYEIGINNIKQNKNFIEVYISKKITDKIDGQKLFMVVSSLTRNFRFSIKFNILVITLDIINLDKHYVYYLIDLLKVIKSSYK